MASTKTNPASNFEDYLPLMAEKLGGEGLVGELCKGFQLLKDDNKGVITFESLKKNAGMLGLQDLTDEDLKSMIQAYLEFAFIVRISISGYSPSPSPASPLSTSPALSSSPYFSLHRSLPLPHHRSRALENIVAVAGVLLVLANGVFLPGALAQPQSTPRTMGWILGRPFAASFVQGKAQCRLE
ncbi:hypothetical protein Cgig2_023416 [Carnegiea gigantea]|uniref:EF-hand domain-containing protein n=1 Tax=Carnegiea gigantea TaxID=171969 RepID=A0A9Q1K300_9CARY|nr:hypothetical protein Cgig2_023416 [Carnegiea gigantea]